MRRRTGTSLIELVAVMATCVMIVGLVGGMIRTLFQATRTAEEHWVRHSAVRQLCEAVRTHAWAANDAVLDAQTNGSRVVLSRDDSNRVEFAASGRIVTRVDYEAGQARRRESYVLPDKTEVRFESVPSGTSTVLRVVIAQRSERAAARELRIEAVIGRDLRYTKR